MALDYTYCGDAGYPWPHRSSIASFDQDDGFGNLIDTRPLESRGQGTRFFHSGADLEHLDLFSGY